MGLTVAQGLYGQSATSTVSPYSLFGIGEIEVGNYGENTGMGGLGIGMLQANTLNTSNPAALSGIYSKTFIVDGALFGKSATYSGQGRSASTLTGNVRRLALGFRMTKHWTVSAGLMPYSNVGYDIRRWQEVEGGSTMDETSFNGQGGFSKFYVGQSFSLTPHLSLGVNFSYVFGEIARNESSAHWTSQEKSQGERPFFDFGLQYSRKLGDSRMLTLGLVGGYRSKISMYNIAYTYETGSGTVVQDRVRPSSTQYIPEFYGAGASIASSKITVGADFLFQKWSRVNSGSGTVRYKDMNKLTVGLSYTPYRYDPRNYMKTVSYKLGLSVNDSYLSVNRRSGINYSVSGGMVFPLRNMNKVYFGAEYTRNSFRVQTRNSIGESYFKLTLGFSLKEQWFMKMLYN